MQKARFVEQSIRYNLVCFLVASRSNFHDNGHFSPAKGPFGSATNSAFFIFFIFFIFRGLLPCQYFLDNWTLLSFCLLGVYIDQSSSSQIHPKCSLGQDSPNMWSEARFTKSVKWAKLWDFENNTFKGPSQKFAEACQTKNVSFILNPLPSPWNERKSQNRLQRSTVGNLLQKRVHVLPALLNVVGHLRDNRSLDRW